MLLMVIVGAVGLIAGGVIMNYQGKPYAITRTQWPTAMGFIVSVAGLAMIIVALLHHIQNEEASKGAQILRRLRVEYPYLAKNAQLTHNAVYIKFPDCEPGVTIKDGKLAFEFSSDVESPTTCRHLLASAHVKP